MIGSRASKARFKFHRSSRARALGQALTDEDVAAIMKEVDTNGNKSLDFKEFLRLLKHIEDFKSFDRCKINNRSIPRDTVLLLQF